MGLAHPMARPSQNPLAPGIFQRGKTFWLRQTVNGKQERVSLGTTDYAEAVRIAASLRGKSREESSTANAAWDEAVSKYIATKESSGEFRQGRKTGETVRHACNAFRNWAKIQFAHQVNPEALSEFYRANRKNLAESTLQSYTAKVGAFLKAVGVTFDPVKFEKSGSSTKTALTWARWRNLIDDCPRNDLRFVLHCGFDAGLRKDEIIMARSSWFDLEANLITIPRNDPKTGWEPKSKRERKVPIFPQFRSFLESHLVPGEEHVLHPNILKGKSRYRWDFRRPFDEFMAEQEVKDFSPHCMRHSYITHLCLRGIPLPLISAWSGDRIKTIESHYWHAGASEEAVSIAASDITPEERLKKLLASVNLPTVDNLTREWTEAVNPVHALKYSVEDTIGDRAIFTFLVDPGDGSPGDVITEEDWTEGTLSTTRARLRILEDLGFIKPAARHP